MNNSETNSENRLEPKVNHVEKRFNKKPFIALVIIVLMFFAYQYYDEQDKKNKLQQNLVMSEIKTMLTMAVNGHELKDKVYTKDEYGKSFGLLNILRKNTIKLGELISDNNKKSEALILDILNEKGLKNTQALMSTKLKIQQLDLLYKTYWVENNELSDGIISEIRNSKDLSSPVIDSFVKSYSDSYTTSRNANKKLLTQFISVLNNIVDLLSSNPKSYVFQNGEIKFYDENVMNKYNNYIIDIQNIDKQLKANIDSYLNK